MKRNILLYGFISGMLLCSILFYTVYLCYNNPDFKGNDIVGYTVMIAVFSMVFFGIRNYRNKEWNGTITFGKAFQIGAGIAFLASTIYVVVWLFCYYLFVPDFLDKYILHVMKEAQGNGASPEEMATKAKEMENFKEMYRSPIMVALITYLEVLPIGIIVALFSALILKKKGQGNSPTSPQSQSTLS